MISFVLIFVCIVAGVLFRKSKTLPVDAHKGINAWIVYLALPAVSFKYLPHIRWSSDLIVPVLSPLIVCAASWILMHYWARWRKLSPVSEGTLKLTTGLSNTSFVGFPLVTAYFGEAAISVAVICDQMTFILLSTVGVITSIKASGKEEVSAKRIARRIITFPPFIGWLAALTVPHFVDITPIAPLFDKLAATISPMALFSIGLQLRLGGWFQDIRDLSVAVAYKLVVAPLLVLGFIYLMNAQHTTIGAVSFFEAAMPSLLSAAIIVDKYGLNMRLANMVIGVSIVLSMITTALWYQVL